MIEFDIKSNKDKGAEDQYQGLSIPRFDWSKPEEDAEDKRIILSSILYEKNPYLHLYFEKIQEIYDYIYNKNIAEGHGRKILALDAVWMYALSRLSNAMDQDIMDKGAIEPNLKEAIIRYCEQRAQEVGPMYRHVLKNNLQDKVRELDDINSNKEDSPDI